MGRFSGNYPDDWKAIAKRVKDEAGWICVRCKHPHDPQTGYTLTVHHLDNNKSNTHHWNLAALCQRCHLHIQGKVQMEQVYMFEHSEWFRPFAAGYYAYRAGLPHDRESVMTRLDEYLMLALPKPYEPPPRERVPRRLPCVGGGESKEERRWIANSAAHPLVMGVVGYA